MLSPPIRLTVVTLRSLQNISKVLNVCIANSLVGLKTIHLKLSLEDFFCKIFSMIGIANAPVFPLPVSA